MPKINREEYEVLKELDDKWKWIARDGECDSLNVFSVKPIKVHSQWDYIDVGYKHSRLTKEENKMFQFIQWKDDEPHNITELIEEYEDLENLLEEEQKYYVLGKHDTPILFRDHRDRITETSNLSDIYPKADSEDFEFTEQEIKDYDPRYWAFRKPVEELEE